MISLTSIVSENSFPSNSILNGGSNFILKLNFNAYFEEREQESSFISRTNCINYNEKRQHKSAALITIVIYSVSNEYALCAERFD